MSDLDQMPRGYRYEVIDGVLYMAAMPLKRHSKAVHDLLFDLGTWVLARGLGYLMAPTTGIYWNEINYVDPDLMFLTHEQWAADPDHIRSATLVIEVLSPSNARAPREDREALFARVGVQEIWYIDPKGRTVELRRRTSDGFTLAALLGATDVVESPVFPGYSLHLGEFWGP